MKLTVDEQKRLGVIWLAIFDLGASKDHDIEAYGVQIIAPYIDQLESLLKIRFNDAECKEVTLYMATAFSHGYYYGADQIGARINDLEEEMQGAMDFLGVELSLKVWEISSYAMNARYEN